MVKNPSANTGDARDAGLTLMLGRPPGEGDGNSLQYSCLRYSPWGLKELDMTEHTHQ